MENWNRDDWQGKRKEQVEYSNGVMFLTFILVVLLLIILGINFLIT